jgi:hypothetical protein
MLPRADSVGQVTCIFPQNFRAATVTLGGPFFVGLRLAISVRRVPSSG